ncbi:MAG: hypothetical protein ACO3LT_09535, partial [Ilumatobacteraceae bacterium]
KGGNPVYSGATVYEIASPYSTAQLREVQFCQINDVMFLAHEEVTPRKLARVTDVSWTLTELFADEAELRDNVTYPPFRDQNVDLDKTVRLKSGGYTAWAASTAYVVGDGMSVNNVPYICTTNHTSDATAAVNDLAKGYWRHIGWNGSSYDTVDLVSSLNLFGDGVGQAPVGAFLQLSYKRPAASISYNLTANTTAGTGNTNILSGVYGTYNVRTYGIWSAKIKIQRSYEIAPDSDDDWETIAEYVGKSDRNVDSEATETRANAFYRIVVEDYATSSPAGSYTPRVVLEVQDQYVNGLVKVTSITSPTTARVQVYTMIYSTTVTDRWRIGSWNAANGYPRTVTLHEQRIYYGGSSAEPQTVWGSGIDNFEYFAPGGTEDSDPVQLTIASGEQNRIQWLVSRKKLVLGTTGAEWTLGSSDEEIAITPTNVVAKRHSSFGSKALQAIPVNEVVFFAQRNGRKVREFTYSFENDGYVAPDMTRLSEHVTAGGILEWSYQQQRDQILWCVTGAGELVGFTYERIDNVLAWHRHTTGTGAFESVAVTYGDRENDEVWVSVRRTIDGTTTRCVERFDPYTWDYDKASADRGELIYSDCAVSRSAVALEFAGEALYFGVDQLTWSPLESGITVAGLGHLEGETVTVTADGAAQGLDTVVAGKLTLVATADKVTVGLPYTATVRPMKLVTPAPSGTSQGRERKVHELVFNFYQTSGGEYSPDGTNYDVIPYRDTADLMDAPPPLYTGDIQVKLHGGWKQDGIWELRQADPYPLTLRAVTVKY